MSLFGRCFCMRTMVSLIVVLIHLTLYYKNIYKKIEPEHMHEERLNLNISSHKINNAEQKALYFKITHVTLV